MVVVTINILVSPRLSVVILLLVVKSVLSLPDVLVESEVPAKLVTVVKKNKPKLINTEKLFVFISVFPNPIPIPLISQFLSVSGLMIN